MKVIISSYNHQNHTLSMTATKSELSTSSPSTVTITLTRVKIYAVFWFLCSCAHVHVYMLMCCQVNYHFFYPHTNIFLHVVSYCTGFCLTPYLPIIYYQEVVCFSLNPLKVIIITTIVLKYDINTTFMYDKDQLPW